MLRLATLSALLSSLLIAAPVAQAQSQDFSSRIDPFGSVDVGSGVMVTLCHIPPGNPANAQTIEVAQAAVPPHLAHGDSLGECLDECDGGQFSVAQTGQTISYAVGDDGDYQTGVAVDPRFTDNGDGTVKDNLTGLIWLRDANCFGSQIWANALSLSNTLADGFCGLVDSSVVGDWRLPNLNELLSLIDYSRSGPSLPSGHPFSEVQSDRYWASTSFVPTPSSAWCVRYHYPGIFADNWADSRRVWPVRGGQ